MRLRRKRAVLVWSPRLSARLLRRQRPLRLALVALLVSAALVSALAPTTASAEGSGAYIPPVDRPVEDTFRPPTNPYGAGNRGVDYATAAGDEVRASASGEVTFSGRVGLGMHVVVLHPDGLRTSYSFLASRRVERGDRVVQGDVVGVAAEGFHFGARAGDRYVDPLGLFGASAPPVVRLVPLELRSPQSEGRERAGLAAQLLATGVGWLGRGRDAARWLVDRSSELADRGEDAVRWAGRHTWEQVEAELRKRYDQVRLFREYQHLLTLDPLYLREIYEQAQRFRAAQDDCTPAEEPVPPPPPERRIAVLVGGLWSAGGDASVLDVDTAALGYDPADVVQFSYAGGVVPGIGDLAGVTRSNYEASHTEADLGASGTALHDLLEDVAAAHPGVPVDVVAHSMGGVVARDALADGAASVERVVTLASPHDGADAATGLAALDTTGSGSAAVDVGEWVAGAEVGGHANSVNQLSESSTYLEALAERDLPDDVRVTSIAASGDLMVPALHSSLDGATNALVPLRGVSAHDELPGSDDGQREVALALAGRAPTCRDTGLGLLEALAISNLEDGISVGATAGALYLDRRGAGAVPRPPRGRRPPRNPD